jgi:hypothetical protein
VDLETPHGERDREEIDRGSDSNAISPEELKCAMVSQQTASVRLADLARFPALRRDNCSSNELTLARNTLLSAAIRDGSALLSMR